MALGMTGFGRSSREHDSCAVSVEVKSVNNRFLKVSVRLPDILGDIESEIEARVRKKASRGSVYCQVRLERKLSSGSFELNEELIRDIYGRLSSLADELKAPAPTLSEVAALDGMITEHSTSPDEVEPLQKLVMGALDEALAGMVKMREQEGAALTEDLLPRIDRIVELCAGVSEFAPKVVEEYRDKLKARLEKLLADTGVEPDPADLVREVAYFADRCDITEETTRLAHHCEQFRQVIEGKGEVGRRLDFIAQELLREANTIGSKANDAALARQVVEMKSEIEKIKEQIQNLE